MNEEAVEPDHRGGPGDAGGSTADVEVAAIDELGGGLTGHRRNELSGAKRALVEARRRRAAMSPSDVPADGPHTLSSAQERVWLLDQVDGGTAAYNAPRAVRIKGPLDVTALQRSLDEIVRRHEVLRTVVTMADGEPAAKVLDPTGAECTVVDVSELSGAARDVRVRELVDAEVQRPFDLATDVLLRALVVRISPEDHVLAIVSHHVASDDRSKRIVAAELEVLYPSFSRGETPTIPDLPLQYGQFARWEQARLASPTFRADIEYWKQRLHLLPPPLDLPTDFGRPPHWSYEGATFSSILDAPASRVVKESALEMRATLFMVLEAAFVAMLGRLSASDDVVIGTPVSGRTHPELDDLIGYFSNTLVLRHDLADDPSFRMFVDRVRHDVVAAFEHQSVPFERLVEEVGPERDPGRHPFFQAMFTVRPGGVSVPSLGDLTVTPFKFRSGTTKFDLSLIAIDEPGGIRLVWEYSTKLFTEGTIARLAERYETLLRGALAKPDLPLGELPLIGRREQRELLDWGSGPDGRTADGESATLVSGFLATVDAYGASVAVRDPGGRSLTFDELDASSARLSRLLIELGVVPGDRVGVFLDRSVDLVATLVAIQRAGAAYVPLDPDYPADRVAFVLSDAEVTAVVSRTALLEGLGDHDGPVVDLDADHSSIEAQDGSDPGVAVAPDDVAYVIYTSGSTGRPKGVVVPHRGVVNILAEMAARPGLSHGDVMVGPTTPAFDLSVPDLFLPLLTGATLVLAAPEAARDPRALAQLFDDVGADLVQATPSTWRMLCESGWRGRPSMRIVCGGEGYGPELVDALTSRVGEVWNFYGPTEASVWAVSCRLDGGQPGPVPMGRPIGNMSCAVVDDRGHRCPIGVAGELWLAGEGLAVGYLGRDDLTAERFVERGLGASTRWYRTGDVVRYRADGSLVFVGRSDHQVKLRGFRVELGEIESALVAQDGVSEAVVVMDEDRDGEPRLVAYLVGSAIDSERVRDGIRAVLPGYMVPSALLVLDSLPLTANGKLDRGALPEPGESGPERRTGRSPITATEVRLADLWCSVLDCQGASADDHFFDVGGHSLRAVRLTALIDRELGVSLPVLTVFEHPVLSDLASQIEAVREGPGAPRPEALDRTGHAVPVVELDDRLALAAAAAGEREGEPVAESCWVFPMSFAQERMWILQALQPDLGTYNMPFYRVVDGELDSVALAEALGTLVARHEVLRTTYRQSDDLLVQVVHETGRMPLTVDASPARTVMEALERTRSDVLRPFDLVGGPVARVRVVPVEDGSSLLVIVVHHIAMDGWSLDVLQRDLDAAYRAALLGDRPELHPLPLQYADLATWQRGWLDGDRIEELLVYWRQELAGLPPAVDYPAMDGGVAEHIGGRRRFELHEGLARSVRDLCRQHGTTPFMVLVAAVGALLNLRTGRDEVAIGIPTSGRHQSEAAGVVGLFVNTLVLRVDTSVSTTFTALLDDIRSRARGAYAHQDLPFERLVDELNPRRSGDRHPLFQVMVALQVDGSGPGTLGGMPLRAVPVEWGANRFDLGFTFAESADDLVVRIEFDRRAFDDAEIERLVGQLQQLLSVVVGDPDVSLEGGMLAEGSDRDHVLDELSGRVRPLDVDCPLQDRVSFHSGSRPDAVAVTFGSESLTYDELEAKSNQMARWLADRGVGPGTLVGVCLERSLDLPIALLGILRAGGAFVPLDPAAPDDRLRFMLDDADVPVVVTSGSSAERVTGRGRTLVLVDVDGPAIGAMPADRPATPVGPDDPAYVIYTSGSTGEPKGVLVEHRGVTNLVEVVEDVFRIDSTSRVLQFASYAFDASVTELLVPLALGATVVMAPASVLASGRGLLDLMDAQRVSVATLPPSLLAVLPDADLPALRTLCSAGEVCPPDVARRWSRGRRFLNGYGPTEATVAVSYAILGDGGAIDEGRLPIGRPIANARAYVVDRTGALVPVGVPGELWIGGAGVARGYLNRPELTAERFVADPFTGAGRLFTTGDRVRWRGDGQLEFLGRMDDQVKLRGFRIELGEIEAVLRAHTAVRDAAAMVREDTPGVARLVAYVVPEPGEAEASGQLRSWARRRLPDYMVPSSVVEVDALPRTLNGKVDRGALPVPEELAGGEDPAGGPEVELSSSEEQVAAVFRELLGIGSIGSDDDFFDVGGNSLLATQLFARIETRFGVSLPLATLFEDATVASVACAVDQARGRSGDPAHAEVPPGPATGAEPAPLVETELVARLKSGDGPTLFLIHELTGEVIVYRDLVKSLPEDVAVYGLRARGIDRKVLPTRRLEEIAAHYIEEIRAQQAEGPYFVGGLCFGGVVALEVAHQLEEQGGTVGLVVPIDAMPRNVKRQDLSPFARIDAELTRLASTRLGRSLQPRLAPVAGRMGRWGDELWRRVTVAIQARGYTPPHRLDNIERSLGRAMRHYARSPRIGAPVLLVRADRGQELNRRAVDRWQQATSAPVVPVMVRGEQVDHRSMVRAPYVSQVTEPLGRALSEGVQILFHESMGGG